MPITIEKENSEMRIKYKGKNTLNLSRVQKKSIQENSKEN